MKKLILSLVASCGAFMTSLSATTFTFYDDETAFLNALSGKALYQTNFASLSLGRADTNVLSFSNSENTFFFTATIPGPPETTSLWVETFGGINALSTGDTPELLVLTNFSLNTFALGGFFFPSLGDNNIVSTGSITVAALFSDLTTEVVTTSRSSSDLNNWFFGWITDEPGTAIQSLTLTTEGNFSSAADITLAVPEPSTYALLAIAVVAMGIYIFRRRRV